MQQSVKQPDFKTLYSNFVAAAKDLSSPQAFEKAIGEFAAAFYPDGFNSKDFEKRMADAGGNIDVYACVSACTAAAIACYQSCHGMSCSICQPTYNACVSHCGGNVSTQ